MGARSSKNQTAGKGMTTVCKKVINNVDTCVDEALMGMVRAYPGLQLHVKQRVIVDPELKSTKVGILSGGGAGHEPFCAGYVGEGMLTGAVSGSVFASPSVSQVLYGIKTVAAIRTGGVLVLIPNYTGDCLNFGLAIERARNENIEVESLIIGEDCALLSEDSSSTDEEKQTLLTERRGMCGMMFIQKIAGALAEDGKPFSEVVEHAKLAMNCIATVGVCLNSCSLPGQPPLFELNQDECEFGMGVHGEAGVKRMKLGSAKEIVKLLLSRLITTLELKSSQPVAVMINNLGATTHLEQYIIVSEVFDQLGEQGIQVERIYGGHIMTALNMSGFQISILNLNSNLECWVNCLDATTKAPSWPGHVYSIPTTSSSIIYTTENNVSESNVETSKNLGIQLTEKGGEIFKECLNAAAKALIENEQHLNVLDSKCGDGDCGSTLKHLAEGLLHKAESFIWHHPATVLNELAQIAESRMGGTSGAVYSLFFTAMAKIIGSAVEGDYALLWVTAFKYGLEGIMKYSRARKGDRTMLDALIPACTELEKELENSNNILEALEKAMEAAHNGCKETKDLKPRAGRARYVGSANLTDVDAGAYAVTVWLRAIIDVLKRFI